MKIIKAAAATRDCSTKLKHTRSSLSVVRNTINAEHRCTEEANRGHAHRFLWRQHLQSFHKQIINVTALQVSPWREVHPLVPSAKL